MKSKITDLLNILGLVFIWRLGLQLISYLAQNRLQILPDIAYETNNVNNWVNSLPHWLSPFANWDSGWYLSIAEKGYAYLNAGSTTSVVFFPFYPLLIRYLAKLLAIDYLLAGLIISLVTIVVAVWYLLLLIKMDYSETIAWQTIIFLLIFPTAIFFSFVYTESLFICLVIMSFYFARQQRWAIVGIIGFLASLTKPWGIIILIPLLFEYLQTINFSWKKINKEIWFLAIMPLGTLIYMQFLKMKFGSYLLFMSGQKLWHQDTAFNFWVTFKNYFSNIFFHISDNAAYQTAISIDFAFFIFGLVISFYIFFKIRKSYGIYSFLTCLIPALTGIFVSMSRYTLVAFPIYLVFALWSQKNKIVEFGLYFLSLTLLAYFMILFVHNYWVA
jgi:Gpi18-like mannosyltransferase